jgi:hypothetical protein
MVDAAGSVPQYHIPARFVTLIPREFPASQPNVVGGKNTNKRKSAPSPLPPPPAGHTGPATKRSKPRSDSDLALNNMLTEMAYGGSQQGGGLDNFDSLDLDFDKEADDSAQEFVSDQLRRFGSS